MMGNYDTHLYAVGFPDGPIKIGSSSQVTVRLSYSGVNAATRTLRCWKRSRSPADGL
jgi:hypothetical protein